MNGCHRYTVCLTTASVRASFVQNDPAHKRLHVLSGAFVEEVEEPRASVDVDESAKYALGRQSSFVTQLLVLFLLQSSV